MLTVLVVWRLLKRLVGRDWPAVAGVMLFAVHPVQVEAIAWIAGAKDLLCALLSLLAVDTFLDFLDAPANGRRRARLLILATILYVAALLSKPTAVTVPLLAWLLARWEGRAFSRAGRRSLVGWFAVAAVWAAVAAEIQQGSGVTPAPVWARPLIAMDALGFYLAKIVWPARLALDYARTPQELLASGLWRYSWIAPAAVLVALAIAPGARRLRVAAGAFVAPLLPVVGLVTFHFQFYSTVADHYLYLSMFGVALAAAWGLSRVPMRVRLVTAVAAGVALAVLTARSFAQVRHWRDSETLFRHTIAVSPSSLVAHHNLGVILSQRGEFEEGIAQLRRAAELRPEYLLSRKELGRSLIGAGRVNEGLEEYRRAIVLSRRQSPENDATWLFQEVVETCVKNGRRDAARVWLEDALRREPENPKLPRLLDELPR
jgi:tetratricopeptide (TPR) repeat protein